MSRDRSGVRSVVAFVVSLTALLSSATAVSALAEERRLPNGEQVTEGIERSLREAAEAEQKRNGDNATSERAGSQELYTDMPGLAAEDLLLREFGDWLVEFDTEPGRFLSDHRLEALRGQTSALVRVDGEPRLFDAGIPVRVASEDGLVKVDLSLVETETGFTPDNPIVGLELPERAHGEIKVGEKGLVLTPVAVEGTVGQVVDDLSLFYPNVQRDLDLLLAPISQGIEIFNQVRSSASPESWGFRVDVPAGAELRADDNGGADVVDGSGIVAKVHRPTALDAQGRRVPVELAVDGDELRLSVPHRGGEFAYPILVDPVVEDWYAQSWYAGANHAALSFWSYTANNGWIYGDTYCIHKTWCPATRGLYVSASNGDNRPANNFGQWSYTAPGSSSRVVQYAISPFWRNNNGCSAGQYGQPHDYVGIWNGSGWSGLLTNWANDVGGAWNTGVGQTLIIGLGTAGGIPKWPCWRDVYVGGVAVWLDDPDWPNWSANPSVADQWVDGTGLPISVSASDNGLGMKYFNVFKTDAQGKIDSLIGSSIHPCSGGRAYPCPPGWSTTVTYNPAPLDEGIRVLGLHAYDALGVWPHPNGTPHHSELKTVLGKVDRSKPEVTQMTGGLLSAGVPSFDLEVRAKDGSANSLQTARSGVEKMRLFLDGSLADEKVKTCNNVPPLPAAQINWGSCEMVHNLQLNGNLTGPHELKAVAVDALGHASPALVQNITIPSDEHDPTVSVSGPATKAFLSAGSHSLAMHSADAQTGVRRLTLIIDGKVAHEDSQGCPAGACPMSREVTINTTKYPAGVHLAKVIATDDKGNEGDSSWEFTIDNQAPQLSPIEASGALAGWIGSDQTVTFTAEATDALSGVDRFEVTRPADKTLGPGEVIVTTHDTSGLESAESISIPTDSMPSGINAVTVKAIDDVGNESTAETLEVKIDRMAPVINAVKGQLLDGAPIPPSTPGNLKATGSVGKVTLAWDASTDDVGVTGYEVYRSTTAGFAPGPANRIATPAATGYVDTTAAGTYYYRVKAVDAAGNLSAASAEASGTAVVETPSAPVATYSFDEGEGAVAHDAVGEHDGAIEGADWVAGRYGGALSFDSAEENCVAIPDSPDLEFLEEFTLEAWVNPSAEGIRAIVTQEDNGAGEEEDPFAYSLLVGGEAEAPRGWLRKGGESGHVGAGGGEPLTENAWSHVALTDDGASLRLYIDGELAGSNAAIPLTSAEGPLTIGCLENYGNYFDGKIDEVRVYDRALSGEEIAADRDAPLETPPSTPGNLKATGSVGKVTLAWDASTDDVGVTGYEVYRSTTAGFAPGPANRIATPAATGYVDTTAAGTYYYRVKAVDAAGNLSAASAEASGTAAPYANPIGRFSDLLLEVSDEGSGVERIEVWADGKLRQVILGDELIGHDAQTCTVATPGRTCELEYEFSVDLGPEPIEKAAQLEIRVTDKAGRTHSKTRASAAVDTQSPELDLSGPLAEADGHELESESAQLIIDANDLGPESGPSGVAELEVTVDGESVHSESFECPGTPCPEGASDGYTYDKVEWGPGPHEVAVTATDKVGNLHTETIAVDGVITAVAPECPSGQASELESSNVITSEAAASAVSTIVPGATAPTESLPGGEEFLDPRVTKANLNPVNNVGIDVLGTEAGGGIEDDHAATFTVGQAVCLAPAITTPAETAPMIVNGDAVVYANSAPSTDTVIRPTAYGTMVTQHLRNSDAPDSFEWDVHLEEGQVLDELPNGAIAIVEPNGIGLEEVDVPEAPTGAMDPDALQDVETQVALGSQELAEAENYVEGSVIAVIGTPMVVLENGSVIAGVVAKSSATSIKVEPPPGAIEEAVALVVRANASADPRAICAQLYGGSPEDYYDGCGPIPIAEEEAGQETEAENPETTSMPEVLTGDPVQQQRQLEAWNGAAVLLAKAERPANSPMEADLRFCKEPEARRACPQFYHDGEIAKRATGRLWNVKAENVKSDAFEHGFFAALLIQTNVVNMDEELADALAELFLENHERHTNGLGSDERHERWESRMDMLNNYAGVRIAALPSVTSDLAACEVAYSKAKDGIYIGAQRNPLKWSRDIGGFKGNNLVYRLRRIYGKVVGATQSECGDVGLF